LDKDNEKDKPGKGQDKVIRVEKKYIQI